MKNHNFNVLEEIAYIYFNDEKSAKNWIDWFHQKYIKNETENNN